MRALLPCWLWVDIIVIALYVLWSEIYEDWWLMTVIPFVRNDFYLRGKNRHFYDFCSFYSSCWFFKDISVSTHTRGHKYKLYKHQSSVNAHKYFFSNISDIWNALPSFVVEASSLDCFKRVLNQVDYFSLQCCCATTTTLRPLRLGEEKKERKKKKEEERRTNHNMKI